MKYLIMLKIKILLVVISLPIFSISQIENLKPEFKNLSWIIDDKASEVISTLSYHFGKPELFDKNYPTEKEYNMYYDSLSLWYITKEGTYKENDTLAESTTIGEFHVVNNGWSITKWLNEYREGTKEMFEKHGIKYIHCIPSSWENLKWFEGLYQKYITQYNNGRIKVFKYKYSDDYGDIIKYYIALHPNIEPVNSHACKFGLSSHWVPHFYMYEKPKVKINKPNIKGIWESKTGLPYDVATELGITDNRIAKLIENMNTVNNDVLISLPKTDTMNYNIDIYVNCDTCEYKIYDNAKEDGDIVDVIVNKDTIRTKLTNMGSSNKIIIDHKSNIKLKAISEGTNSPCTVHFMIEEKSYEFRLKKQEIISINLKPSTLTKNK